ncbi:U-scoloptoxin(16)-Er13a-like [Dermacentor silvarum]|uniref:U-scoloptoxin(16)-Er13a-like n=1 Tax=Dermacentor silvarum TaxID=543639 RepID=UPI001898C25C|nr:U-scoloptoxin(16)-Er13a-like [Dermacentor silvarum]
MRSLAASLCAFVAFSIVCCDVQERGHTYVTRNVTVRDGACVFERNVIRDGETKALNSPCVISTCYAAAREVNSTLCPNFGVAEGCRVEWTPDGEYPNCCPKHVCPTSS